jgi:Arc/MetJ-type ribon-helix-helix transcriptional regulator
MSNKLPTGDVGSRKQVKVRADTELVERFDAFVEQSEEYSSRAGALRAAMSRMLGNADKSAAPLVPPEEDDLRESYLALVGMANADGIVPHELATAELSTQLGKSTAVVEHAVIGKLWDRGYLRQITNFNTSNRSWKLVGVEDE